MSFRFQGVGMSYQRPTSFRIPGVGASKQPTVKPTIDKVGASVRDFEEEKAAERKAAERKAAERKAAERKAAERKAAKGFTRELMVTPEAATDDGSLLKQIRLLQSKRKTIGLNITETPGREGVQPTNG